MKHTPLHHIHNTGILNTAGRLEQHDGRWMLTNARTHVPIVFVQPLMQPITQGSLLRITGRWDGQILKIQAYDIIFACQKLWKPSWRAHTPHAHMQEARQELAQCARAYFARHDFLEVATPCWVQEPGTDPHIDTFTATFHPTPNQDEDQCIQGHLQTSPEFAMKRLLTQGFERIYQWTHAWRNGEVTDHHMPEFTILEWYRAWESLDAIIEDVEALTCAMLGKYAMLRSMNTHMNERDIALHRPFRRMTMQEVVFESCGFDILDTLTAESLAHACVTHNLLDIKTSTQTTVEHRAWSTKSMDAPSNAFYQWDELFFELQVTYIDPWLATQGAVCVTEWPAPLAVLARRKPGDDRVALRFELYIGGLEIANGFDELTDPKEQERRFAQDIATRKATHLKPLPKPSRFLSALEQGMPPSAGVAVGIDRLLMLRTGARTIQEVYPFSLQRDPNAGGYRWDGHDTQGVAKSHKSP